MTKRVLGPGATGPMDPPESDAPVTEMEEVDGLLEELEEDE